MGSGHVTRLLSAKEARDLEELGPWMELKLLSPSLVSAMQHDTPFFASPQLILLSVCPSLTSHES